MKIFHVMAPSPVGGAEQVVLDLTAAQARAGAEIHLIAVVGLREGTHPFLRKVQDGVRLHPVAVPPRRYLREAREIRDVIRRLRPEIVHTHGYRSDVVGGLVARSEEIATVTTVHGFTGGGVRNRIYEWLQRRSFRNFDGVVAVSGVLERELKAGGVPASRIVTIPNARSRPRDLESGPDARRALDVPGDAFHIGWIGRMSREKAPDVMLAALHQLCEAGRIPRLRATMIGDGREREMLEARTADLDLGGCVRWAGPIPDAARFLRGFDVVVLSSRTEGTPIVALETMMVGIPLVATAVGGVPALTGSDSAILVEADNPGAIAQAVERVYTDPGSARHRADTAERRVEALASPERWAARYLDVYRKAAHRASSSSTVSGS